MMIKVWSALSPPETLKFQSLIQHNISLVQSNYENRKETDWV